MTWSMHTIGHLQLEDNLRAAVLFNKSYGEYVKEPFKVCILRFCLNLFIHNFPDNNYLRFYESINRLIFSWGDPSLPSFGLYLCFLKFFFNFT